MYSLHWFGSDCMCQFKMTMMKKKIQRNFDVLFEQLLWYILTPNKFDDIGANGLHIQMTSYVSFVFEPFHIKKKKQFLSVNIDYTFFLHVFFDVSQCFFAWWFIWNEANFTANC